MTPAAVVSAIAAIIAAVIAAAAAFIASRQLGSQASSQELSAVMATNDLWRRVQESLSVKVKLRKQTITEIIAAHASIDPSIKSVVATDSAAETLELPAPFAMVALQSAGVGLVDDAPDDELTYKRVMEARGKVVGFTLAHLARVASSGAPKAAEVGEDLRSLRAGVEKYVNVLNEVAELYEAGLVDRRLFLGKRHVTLIQQAYSVEPYILWRNSTYSGRWGLRILSMGEEARAYHRVQVLQQSAVRGRVDPTEYTTRPGYLGFCAVTGWMVGPGEVSDSRFRAWRSERSAVRNLARGFRAAAKRTQNASIQRMPRSAGGGHSASPGVPGPRWDDLLANPSVLLEDARTINRGR